MIIFTYTKDNVLNTTTPLNSVGKYFYRSDDEIGTEFYLYESENTYKIFGIKLYTMYRYTLEYVDNENIESPHVSKVYWREIINKLDNEEMFSEYSEEDEFVKMRQLEIDRGELI